VRVGVLGGTFDPVHNGHLILAEHARDALALDLVLFIPAGEPWRKSDRAITPGARRLDMLRLAIEGNDGFGLSDVELRRAGPTYTADTLETLAGERLDDEFWFIIGADALVDMPNWHEPERIIRHARLAVAPRRPPSPPPWADAHTMSAKEIQQAVTVRTAQFRTPAFRSRIEQFTMPEIDISSTDIRDRVAASRSIRYLVPDPVRQYIEDQHLYRRQTAEASADDHREDR
jgi:nicotinate-nucleotide adenylyltransferase